MVLCDQRTVSLDLTRDELLDLFSRCLQSHEDDNEISHTVLKKLAKAVDELSKADRKVG